MTQAAIHTPPAPSAPAASCAPPALSAAPAAPASGGPIWLVFCVMACSAFAALLGRLALFPQSSSSHSPDSPGDLSADNPFAIIFHLIAIDWFRRFRSAPATPAELLRRSPVAQALLAQPLAPIQPCDLPGQPVIPGTFAPAFAGQLAAASSTPLSLTPSSFLNACFATLSTLSRPALSARTHALFNDEVITDAATTSFISYSAFQVRSPGGASRPHSALSDSAFRIHHSAFLFAPV